MGAAYIFGGLYALGVLATIVGIIYLIIRKQKVIKKENFEKRDN